MKTVKVSYPNGRRIDPKRAVQTLLYRGDRLMDEGRYEQAVAAYDVVITCVDRSNTPSLREFLAKALYNKGIALWESGRYEDEIAVYDDFISQVRTV